MSTTWESLEERERRVRGSRTTSAMARAAEQIPTGKTLEDVFAERPFISREDLKIIAGHEYDGPVITLYLNFAPQRLVRADRPVFLSVFSSLRHEALEARKPYLESLPHSQRLRVPEDLREVQEFLEGYEPEGARSIVIFKSGTQLNRIMPLPVRVADHLTIEDDTYIEPLERILEDEHRVLVVDVSKARTTVSIYELGYEHPIDSVVEDLPREKHEAYREGKTERHRETHIVWHYKASSLLADRIFRDRGADLVVLIGEATVLKAFADYLPKALQDRLIGEAQLPPDAGPNDRRAALDRIVNDQRRKEEEAALSQLGFYQGHQRLAIGLEMVINAANLFLMRQLFVVEDVAGTGFICHDHHFLSLKAGSCPFDNTPLQDTESVVDDLIEMARLHGVDVMVVTQRPDLLAPYEGIAAVLVTATPLDELRAVSVTSAQ
jgi:Bacterial archaeo-eukaryotic release factor family 10